MDKVLEDIPKEHQLHHVEQMDDKSGPVIDPGPRVGGKRAAICRFTRRDGDCVKWEPPGWLFTFNATRSPRSISLTCTL